MLHDSDGVEIIDSNLPAIIGYTPKQPDPTKFWPEVHAYCRLLAEKLGVPLPKEMHQPDLAMVGAWLGYNATFGPYSVSNLDDDIKDVIRAAIEIRRLLKKTTRITEMPKPKQPPVENVS